MDSDNIGDRPSRRRVTSVHGVLTITALLGIYLAGCHFNDYSVDVVFASFITGAIAFVLGISGVAIGFVMWLRIRGGGPPTGIP